MNKNITKFRVVYADTDAAGVVYYGAYLRWLESGREELLRQNGVSYKEYADKGTHAPVVKLDIEYKASAGYDDILSVETSIEKIGNSSLVFHYLVKKGDALLIEARTVNVFIDKDKKPIPVPEEVRKILE